MKQYILYVFCLLMCFFVACNDDAKNTFPTGILYLNVEEDATMLTKAENAVTYESLQVAILQGEEDAQDTVKVFNDYLKDVKSQRLILPIGKYTIAVRSNGVEGAGWETPLYMGQEEVEVKQGEITNTKVVCTIANTKVSVIYENALKDYFTDYQTTVSNPSGTLLYTRDEYRSGFFTPEKLTVQLKLVNKDGNEFVMKKVYPEIEPQYHYKFIYSISNDDTSDQGGFNVDIDVDKNLQEITYNIFIKKEELAGAGQPSAKLSSEFNDGTYTFKRTDETPNPAANSIWLDYTLGSNNALQSFIVTMDSPTLGKSRFDITKGEGSEIGFPALPDSSVHNSDSRYVTYRMDLTDIVTHLGCQDNQPTIHNFTVDLLDDKFQETSITFAIKMMPDVAAYVENPICWTSFAVLKGVCEGENLYFILQEKGDDNSIIEIKTVNNDKKGNITSLVTGLKHGIEYSYWLASEDDLTMSCEPVSFSTHTPLDVPNLSLDDWGERTGKGALSTNVDYKCAQGNNSTGDVYWESGNRGAKSGKKTLLQGEGEDVKKGKAAKLTSQWAGVQGFGGAFSAGSIFSGYVESVSTKGANLVYGQLFNGFPTALKGWYKYHPGIINWVSNSETTTSELDEAIIYIALTTSQSHLQSYRDDIANVKTFNSEGDNVIAYGELRIQNENTTEYQNFTIPLVYKSSKMPETKTDVYLIIMASSSVKGDFFTGSTDSWMLLDELGLVYDYDPDSFVGTEFQGMPYKNINDK